MTPTIPHMRKLLLLLLGLLGRFDGAELRGEARFFFLPATPDAEGIGRHVAGNHAAGGNRSEEHTSELQSLMRISYAVFCLKNKIKDTKYTITMQCNRCNLY